MDKKMIAIIAGTAFISGSLGAVGGALATHSGRDHREFSRGNETERGGRFAERGDRMHANARGAEVKNDMDSREGGVTFSQGQPQGQQFVNSPVPEPAPQDVQ